MRRSLVILACIATLLPLSITAATAAGDHEPYQQIRVTLTPSLDLRQLLAVPGIELLDRGDGEEADVVSRPSLTRELIRKGWQVLVIQPDLESFYAARQGAALDYGVWHTYDETVAELYLLHSQFPSITTAPISLGRTEEGRDIWAIKVSDNADVDEDEPEVMYDGVHHAREIMTVEMTLYFARYLCENYGTDPVSSYLVNNREVWFIPIVNVDGFVYNELTNPDGGGMWRKNRRDNGGDCFGVDNNRNYPFEWVGPGSSTDPCNETYRGPSAGSEPENQAVMALVNAHHFVIHNSWHSVAGLHLIPWSYTLSHTPDDTRFRQIGDVMAKENGYPVGQAPELLYEVNGGMTDWMYGALNEHAKIYSFSTEISGSGFWPGQSERPGLIAENLASIIYTTQIAGAWVTIPSLTILGGDGRMDPGDTIDLMAVALNDGLSEITNVSVRLTCDDPYVSMLDASNDVGTIAAGQRWDNGADPFSIRIDDGCPIGRSVTFTVIADGSNGLHSETHYTFGVGENPAIYGNDFETSNDWVRDATHTALTGAFVCVDPVGTEFQPADDTTPGPGVNALITAQNPNGLDSIDDVDVGIAAVHSPDFNLAGYPNVQLSMNYFHGQRDTGDDPAGDYLRIDVSSDAGSSWVNLLQIADVATAPDWRNLTVSLNDFITLTSQVRLRVQTSDRGTATDICEGGIDDVYLYNVTANRSPDAPVASSPINGAEVSGEPLLVVENANDPDQDQLTYSFRVYSDADLTILVASVDGIAEGEGTTSWQVAPPLETGTYYWRAFAADAESRGLYSETRRFHAMGIGGATDTNPQAAIQIVAEPNPAPAGIRIRYMVPNAATSRLAVYDLEGRVVRRLETIPSATGRREITWDGNDDAGRPVASGSYWVRLWTPGETRTVRVVRIQ
jgi:hypothetical protein